MRQRNVRLLQLLVAATRECRMPGTDFSALFDRFEDQMEFISEMVNENGTFVGWLVYEIYMYCMHMWNNCK